MVKKSISISIDEEIIDFIEKKAKEEKRSVSYLFNEILINNYKEDSKIELKIRRRIENENE